jgi:photosystem II stability/assembly factor-like uncharacterized protein
MRKSTAFYATLTVLMVFALLLSLSACVPAWEQVTTVSAQTPAAFNPTPTLYSVSMLSNDEGWAVGGTFVEETPTGNTEQTGPQGGIIYHYLNGMWAYQPVSTPLFSVSALSPKDGWAVGYAGTIFHYNGTAWTTVNSPTSAILLSVFMVSATDGWIVGYGGTILHYNGHIWESFASPTSANLRSIFMDSAEEGWAVGENGTILHFVQGQWKLANSPTINTLNSVFMISSHEGWIGGEPASMGANTALLHYIDGSWQSVQSPYEGPLNSVFMTSSQEGWIASTHGTLLHYQNGAWLYKADNSNSAFDLYSIFMTSPTNGWAVGQENLIRHYTNGSWTTYSVLKRIH